MKTFTLTILVLAQSLMAHAKYPDDVHNIDWNDRSSLDYVFVQMCDDAYFTNLKLVVPGRDGVDYKFNIDDPKCSVQSRSNYRSGKVSTEITINGSCGATIHIDKTNSNQSALVTMSDGC
jgi:hypothetical protein